MSGIDLFHNGDRIEYSFLSTITSLSNLAVMGKIQHLNESEASRAN